MKLVRVYHKGNPRLTMSCTGCSRPVLFKEAIANLEGEPFTGYYHEDTMCLPEGWTSQCLGCNHNSVDIPGGSSLHGGEGCTLFPEFKGTYTAIVRLAR